MPFAAAASEKNSLSTAIQETVQMISGELGRVPDLTIAFVSQHHAKNFPSMAASIVDRLGGGILLGCTGETIIGGHREYEEGPAFSLWCGVLPGADLVPFQLEFAETPDGFMCSGLPDDLGARAKETRAVLLLLSLPLPQHPRSPQ